MKLIVILCLLLGFAISFPAAAENRVALVIGNANYVSQTELPNGLNDAKDMAEVLRGYGFKVIAKMDADTDTTLEALDELGDELKNGGVGLVYYSGHGLEVDGKQYIVPVDAHLGSKSKLTHDMIDVNVILAKVGESKSQLNVVILDACRNNPYAKALGIKAVNKGFSKIQDAPSGTLIASATAVGDTSSGAGARNSVYTAHLLKYLRENPNDEIRLLLGDVTTAVKTATGSGQVPWVSGSIDGRFYLTPDVVVSAARQPAPQITAPQPQPSFDEKPTPIVSAPVREQPTIATPEPPVQTVTPQVYQPTPQAMPSASEEWKTIDRYQVKDGLVKDTVTGLMWLRCSLGQTWDGFSCGGEAKKYTWEQAMKTPDGFSYGGYSDWHLPSREELITLVYCSSDKPKTWNDTGKSCEVSASPTINRIAFPQTLKYPYWSSSPIANHSYGAWFVSVPYTVYDNWYPKSDSYYVRLVRSGQ